MRTYSPHIIAPSFAQKEKDYKPKVYFYTLLAYALLVLSLLFQWSAPPSVPPATEDILEVNLGNVESAFGDAPPRAVQASPPVPTPPPTPTSVSPIEQPQTETVTSDDAAIASVPPPKPPSPPKKTKTPPSTKPTPNPPPTPPPNTPQPAPEKKPIAVFSGQGDAGDEYASNYDSYGKSNGSQGIGTGKGDMGVIGGSLSSDNYNLSVVPVAGLGNRKIIANPALNQDFEHEGIVQIQAIFGRNGQFISARQDIKNSTTSQRKLVAIAMEHVQKIRLNEDEQSAQEQAVTFRFVFKIQL